MVLVGDSHYLSSHDSHTMHPDVPLKKTTDTGMEPEGIKLRSLEIAHINMRLWNHNDHKWTCDCISMVFMRKDWEISRKYCLTKKPSRTASPPMDSSSTPTPRHTVGIGYKVHRKHTKQRLRLYSRHMGPFLPPSYLVHRS